MKISIIIPVYNVEDYISECLESVASLNLDYEIIIVNDGSTDNSIKIINDFVGSNCANINVISKENGGLSSARNMGIRQAKGDYLFFLDSDDYIDGNLFETFVKEVVNDGVDIGFADCKYLIDGKIVANKNTAYRIPIAKSNNNPVDGLTFGEKFFDKKRNFINTEACFLLISKSFLVDNNIEFKSGIYHEDTLFTLTCLSKAQRVNYYDYPFYVYRMREDSIMHTPNPVIIEKKFKDKGFIAFELFKIKQEYHLSKTFIDSIIVDLLLVSAMHFKTTSTKIDKVISRCNNRTLKSRIRVAIYKIMSLSYK